MDQSCAALTMHWALIDIHAEGRSPAVRARNDDCSSTSQSCRAPVFLDLIAPDIILPKGG